MEFVCVAKYVIPKEEIPTFKKQYQLQDYASHPLEFDDYLSTENMSGLTNLSQCYSLSDCKGGNHWYVLLNEVTGELWIEVTYPDMGGDAPPCDND